MSLFDDKGPSIQIVVKVIILLFLTSCDAMTVNNCNDFVSVKVWRNRRQLLIHQANLWLRETVAWEPGVPYGYVVREASNGLSTYRAIYDENMYLRECKVTQPEYADIQKATFISAIQRECGSNETVFNRTGDYLNVLHMMLQTNYHTSQTFSDVKLALIGEVIEFGDKRKRRMIDDTINRATIHKRKHFTRELFQYNKNENYSLVIYKKIDSDSPPVINTYLDFDGTIAKCNEHIESTLLDIRQPIAHDDTIMGTTPSLWNRVSSLPRSFWKRLEAIGLQDGASHQEEDELFEVPADDIDIGLTSVTTLDDIDDHNTKRHKRGLFMFPGTLWCGTGNRAPNDDSLGIYNNTDNCCRIHDHSPSNMQITTGESKYHFKNWGMYTLSHCSIDKKFHKCLRQVKNTVAYEVGRGYFNVFNVNCFVIRKRKMCLKVFWYMPWKCEIIEYVDTACLRSPRVFPSEKYIWPT